MLTPYDCWKCFVEDEVLVLAENCSTHKEVA